MEGLEPLISRVVPWMLVVCRVAGLFLFAPMVSSAMLPARVRAFLAAGIGLAAGPLVAERAGPLPPMNITSLPWLIISETLIGLTIGMIAVIPILALDLAGVLMGHQMGLNLARVYNPDTDAEVDALGQMLFFVGFAGLIAIDGVESLFLALLATFDRVPVGGLTAEMLPLETLIGVLESGTDLAVRIAAPVWGVVAVMLVAIGLLGKFVPQVNTMTVGFILKILVGIAALAASMRVVGEVSQEAMQGTIAEIGRWVSSL